MTQQEATTPSSTTVPPAVESAAGDTMVSEQAVHISGENTVNVVEPESVQVNSTPTLAIEELQQQLADMTKKADSYWDSLLRQRAEQENMQKRLERDLERARKFALEKFAQDLLPIKDSMELGLDAAMKPDTNLQTLQEGIGLTLQMLSSALEKAGITEINPLNEKFNPELHEAMVMQPAAEVEPNTILFVHQKGYQLNERLLRPARVVVSKRLDS